MTTHTTFTQKQAGFTLVEMIVAVALFAIVMTIAVGSLLTLINANRKAQALQSVMENLNVALDGMVRAARMGTSYHCGGAPYTTVQDCAQSSGTVFAFEPYGGDSARTTDQWVYAYVPASGSGGGYIQKSEDGGTTWIRVTAPEVSIDDMHFYVIGSLRGCSVAPCDVIQPKMVVTIKGTAGSDDNRTRTTFSIQATAVQRLLDI